MWSFSRFMNMLNYTPVYDNPDSWEGWHWGATHTYGFYWRLGMPEQFDLLEDALKNTEMIVFWSNDPDTTRGTYSGQESAIWRVWLKEKASRRFIDPFYNTPRLHGRPLAGSPPVRHGARHGPRYVWLTMGTYDKNTSPPKP
jgi:trimethylamine-N-oxide reductase (cytochrome c)